MDNCKDCGRELSWDNSCLCIKCKQLMCEDCFEANQMKCKECSPPEKKVQLECIRRSHLEDWKQCPYYFKLNVIDGIESNTHPLAQLGIDLHDLYDMAQKGDIEVKELDNRIERIIDSYDFKQDWLWEKHNKDEFKNKAYICNKNFKTILGTLGDPIAFEERLYFDIGKGLPQITIAYDRLDRDQYGNLHIRDWKTGRCMSGKQLSSDLQPALYIYAVHENYGIWPESFTLYYLSDVYKDGRYKQRTFYKASDDVYICEVGKKRYNQCISEQIKEVKRICSHIKNGNFSVPDREIFKCKVCSYKEKGLCQGSTVQDFYNEMGENWQWK